MKQHRLAGAAAAAAIIALSTAGAAHAESAAPTTSNRITSAEQLQANLHQAIALEQAQAGTLGTGPAGKAID